VRRGIALLTVLSVLAALVIAGCGSSSSTSPLGTGLSYFPKDSLFVMSLQTDPNSGAIQDAQGLLHRFPAVTFGEAALMARLEQLGINYSTDIRPLFGNPAVIGVASPSATGARTSFLVAWVTKDADTLNNLIKKAHLSSSQTIDGAKVYSISTASLAVDGATLVLAASPEAIKSALDLHAHGGGLTTADQDRAMGDLPTDSLISAFGDLSAVLAQPSAAKARQVPWVAALRGYGVSISANATGLTTQYRLDTSGATLTGSELPIPPGSTPPGLAGSLPISVGVKDPARIAKFVEQAQALTSPASYAAFLKHQAAVRAKTGVDINSLLNLLTGEAQLSSDGKVTMIRGQLSDPAAGKTTLAKLATDPKAFSSGPIVVAKAPGGFYVLKERTHSTTIGVVGDMLVVGIRATPPQLTAFAGAPSTPAQGAQGSVAFKVALPSLLTLALKRAPNKTVATLLSSLGDLTGWLAAAPAALTGSATVALK
jgi:Protein of unknown function (DUF3352)